MAHNIKIELAFDYKRKPSQKKKKKPYLISPFALRPSSLLYSSRAPRWLKCLCIQKTHPIPPSAVFSFRPPFPPPPLYSPLVYLCPRPHLYVSAGASAVGGAKAEGHSVPRVVLIHLAGENTRRILLIDFYFIFYWLKYKDSPCICMDLRFNKFSPPSPRKNRTDDENIVRRTKHIHNIINKSLILSYH